MKKIATFWEKLKQVCGECLSSLFAYVLSIFLKIYYWFIPVEYRGDKRLLEYLKNKGPVILVFWHGRSFFPVSFWRRIVKFRRYPIYGIFSTHKDGKFIGQVFSAFGVKNIASKKGDAKQGRDVVVKSLKLLKKGNSLGFTPDGPVGPRMNFVTESAFLFAKASGVPIVPIYSSSKRAKLLGSWDRYMVPKPFCRAVVSVGDFLFIPKNVKESELKKIKSEFEKKMVAETQKLDLEMKMPKIEPDDGSDKLRRTLKYYEKCGNVAVVEDIKRQLAELEKIRKNKQNRVK